MATLKAIKVLTGGPAVRGIRVRHGPVKLGRKIALLECLFAFRLRKREENAVPGMGVRHFSCKFPEKMFLLGFWVAEAHNSAWSLSYVHSYVCFHMCALICVLASVSSPMYALLYALICVLSSVSFHVRTISS